MHSVLIRGGTIVDGTGRAGYQADLAVHNGVITDIGNLKGDSADEILSADGLVVAPGFFDAHAHSDTAFVRDSSGASKLYQGITTEISGNCGDSPFPCAEGSEDREAWLCPSMDAMLRRFETEGWSMAVNQAMLVGHGTLRQAVMGDSGRTAEDEEIGKAVSNLYRKHLQLQKLKISKQYQKCPQCGRLMAPEESLCDECRRIKRDKITAAVRQVLRDMPWARYPDVKQYVPECTPKIVNEQRSIMVQQLAADTDVNDKTSMKAKTLVMLYRCLPPEQLNEDNITRALYALRFDMHRPKDYKTPKRYDVIKLGRR